MEQIAHKIENQAKFQTWVAEFRQCALRNGISGRMYDTAMATVRFRPDFIAKDQHQPEFSVAIWDYLDRAVTSERVKDGLKAVSDNQPLLAKISARYRVPVEIIVAIWGLETNYGTQRGDYPTIEALATLAFDTRRAEMFEAQLLAALKIVQDGDVPVDQMRGSWAGAMGHTQFMPTSYRRMAVDFDGDGTANIWGDDPGDALASTAAYLAGSGWDIDQPDIAKIDLPDDFDFAQSGLHVQHSAAGWREFGIALDGAGMASVWVPAGAGGPAFLVADNFRALLSYNQAPFYALAVTQLADEFRGGGGIRSVWPREDVALDREQRQEFQERLTRNGYDTKQADAIFGPDTFAALRSFQSDAGLVADGYPTFSILLALREMG